jgi:hypothetical protein
VKRLSDEVAALNSKLSSNLSPALTSRLLPPRHPRQHPPGRNAALDNSCLISSQKHTAA